MSLQRRFNRKHKPTIMRTLSFAPDQTEIFELIHTSLMVTEKQLTKREYKLHSSIQDKLDEISVFKDNDKDQRTLKFITPTPTLEGEEVKYEPKKILLEEQEYNLLKECLEAVKYRAAFSRRVNSMWDYLESIPEEKLKSI